MVCGVSATRGDDTCNYTDANLTGGMLPAGDYLIYIGGWGDAPPVGVWRCSLRSKRVAEYPLCIGATDEVFVGVGTEITPQLLTDPVHPAIVDVQT